jgi:5-epi-alpha-selinene synthase
MHNYAIVLQRQNQWSLDHAIAEVASRHDGEVRKFLKLEQELPTFGGPYDGILRRYVSMLRCWMRGNLDWSRECVRYVVVRHFAGQRDPEV